MRLSTKLRKFNKKVARDRNFEKIAANRSMGDAASVRRSAPAFGPNWLPLGWICRGWRRRSFLVIEFEVEKELRDRVVFLGTFWLALAALGFSAGFSAAGAGVRLAVATLGLDLGLAGFDSASSARGIPSTSGSGSPSSNSISNSSCSSSSDGDGVQDGGVGGLGLGIRARSGPGQWAWPSWATRSVTAPTVSSSPCFKGLLPGDLLAIDERPVGTAEVADRELVRDLKKLAMAPADLRRLDADQAVIVATDDW